MLRITISFISTEFTQFLCFTPNRWERCLMSVWYNPICFGRIIVSCHLLTIKYKIVRDKVESVVIINFSGCQWFCKRLVIRIYLLSLFISIRFLRNKTIIVFAVYSWWYKRIHMTLTMQQYMMTQKLYLRFVKFLFIKGTCLNWCLNCYGLIDL